MAKEKPEKLSAVAVEQKNGQRPRLSKLKIKNFRCIGSDPVVIHLDDIVVLVGPNNVGKSSVLKAYELIMSEGTKGGDLAIDDFPNAKVDNTQLPEIELDTIVFDNSPGEEWIENKPTGEKLVREKWTWAAPGKPTRRGFNVKLNRWTTDEDRERVPWGAAGVANSRRPQPHRVDALASPEEQSRAIIKLLMSALQDRVKEYQAIPDDGGQSGFGSLLTKVAELQKKIVADSESQISAIESALTSQIERIFPGHKVVFDARPEEGLEKSINLFKTDAQLLMGPGDGHLSSLDRQGSGARRTLLWVAIRLLAETEASKKESNFERPFVLLLDEPEICLHPGAIREACELLYSLPQVSGKWQVMITTHSPCFVDFSRDHTSIVRVERSSKGTITGTTIFRPEESRFDGDDRELLKLLNICDPFVAEFFFGGSTILVEGDTEYAALKHIIACDPGKYGVVHIVRARGKATLVALAKILNQFGSPYSVLHDSDKPYFIKGNKEQKNPAWSLNDKIRLEVNKASSRTRLVASLPTFEPAYLGDQGDEPNKPYNALYKLREKGEAYERVSKLLEGLISFDKELPKGATEWKSLGELEHLLGNLNGKVRN